jgi:hypothetical protein
MAAQLGIVEGTMPGRRLRGGYGASLMALVIAGCGGGTLDAAKVASSVQSQFEGQTKNLLTSITGNDGKAVSVGSKISCDGQGANGHGYAFDVTLKDANGAIEWMSTALDP